MAKIAIIVELKERDLLPSVLLEYALSQRNHTVLLVSHYDLVGTNLLLFRPDIIIVNGLRSDENYITQIMMPKKLFGAKIVSLYSEQLDGTTGSVESYNNDLILANVDAHISWGRKFAEYLVQMNVDPQKIWITGSHRLDLPFYLNNQKSYVRDYLSRKYQLKTERKWILISDNILDVEKEKPNSYSYRRNNFDACVKKIAQNFKETEIIFRPHPAMKKNELEEVKNHLNGLPNIKFISDEHISLWCTQIDLVVIWKSTSAIDAWANNIPSLAYVLPNDDKNLWYSGLMDKFTNHDEMINTLKGLLNEGILQITAEMQMQRSSFIDNWYFRIDGLSTLRTMHVIEQALSTQPNSVKKIRNKSIPTLIKSYSNEYKAILSSLLKGNKLLRIDTSDIKSCHKFLSDNEVENQLKERIESEYPVIKTKITNYGREFTF
jgi:hypothetical protein